MADYAKQKTLVVVTHRRPILALTERLILIEHGNVVMDGPKDEILKSLVKMAPSLTLFNILIATFASALAWSVWFTIDKSTNVTGVVEPKGNVISLQNRFDSKIKEVIVDAGDKVFGGANFICS